MLCTLADKLWGSTTIPLGGSCEYISPSKSTEPSDNETISPQKPSIDDNDKSCATTTITTNTSTISDNKTIPIEDENFCSVWMVDGNDAAEVMDNATIIYNKDDFVIKGRQVKHVDGKKVTIEEGGIDGGMEKSFKYLRLVQFRQCNEDIYQWLMSNDSNNAIANEYGVLLNNIHQGSTFSINVYKGLINSCADGKSKGKIFEIECEFKEYDRGDSKWIDICNDCVLHVCERNKDKEAYMILVKKQDAKSLENISSLDNNNILCVLTLSHEDYIYPLPSENKLTWWGPDIASAHGHRKMFTAVFNKKKNKSAQIVENLYAYITNITSKHPAICGGNIQEEGENIEYKECDFSMDIDTEDPIELIDDSQDCKNKELVLCRDSTRDKIIQNPNAKLHKLMYVGKDRTFVVRGSNSNSAEVMGSSDIELSILKFTDEGKEEVVATVGGNKLKHKNDFIRPIKGLLSDSETKMLFVDEINKNNIYNMDIENETIISKHHNDSNIHNIVETYKGASTTSEPTFLVHNANQLLTMDSRVNDKKQTPSILPNVSYASNVQFTCAGVDSQGHILMGSKMGDMRLYDGKANKDGKLKRAKTHLLGLGDPLLNVCVNKDGSWILGTCSKYLVVFPVKLSQNNKTGFVTALGKSKPKPIILKLNMADMCKHNIDDLYFQKAEFNTNESAIVTSTGNLAIIWNFQKVIENNANGKDVNENSYTIKRVSDYIKDIGFIKGGERGDAIVVATPCGLTTAPVTKNSSNHS